MKNNILTELVVAVVIVVLLAFLVNPKEFFWMPDMNGVLLVVLLVVAVSIFGIFAWREVPADERESYHRLLAARIAFLSGAVVLVAGIVFQSVKHLPLDWWLAVALGTMVLAKAGGLIYGKTRH